MLAAVYHGRRYWIVWHGGALLPMRPGRRSAVVTMLGRRGRKLTPRQQRRVLWFYGELDGDAEATAEAATCGVRTVRRLVSASS